MKTWKRSGTNIFEVIFSPIFNFKVKFFSRNKKCKISTSIFFYDSFGICSFFFFYFLIIIYRKLEKCKKCSQNSHEKKRSRIIAKGENDREIFSGPRPARGDRTCPCCALYRAFSVKRRCTHSSGGVRGGDTYLLWSRTFPFFFLSSI